MYNIVPIITLLLSCYFLLRILRITGTTESILAFFCLSTAHIVIWGNVLSFMSRLSDLRWWSILGLTTALVNFSIVFSKRDSKQLPPWLKLGYPFHLITSIKNWYTKEISHFERLLLTPLILTVLILGITNLVVIVLSAPHTYDSMAYHLARVAYYLQHNNTNYFDAGYWAQVIHPKNSSLLLIYTYLVSGRNENLTQLVQFMSYWVAVCSVYAISRMVGNSKTQSIFAATVGALLTEWLMEATTTQNDMILTAYAGATIYFLFAFRETHECKHLGLAALGIGLSIGTKSSSFLVLLPVALVAFYTIFQYRLSIQSNLKRRLRDFAILSGYTLLAVCIFALPSGYIENYRNFGHPIGPYAIRAHHSYEGEPISYIARNGTKNLARYGFDFLSLDGIPAIGPVRKIQTLMRLFPEKVVRILGIDLEGSEATVRPFYLQKMPDSDEDSSYWGIFGFGLVWVMVFLSAVGVIKSKDIRVLSLAAVLFLLSQAYCGPYDPWRGRYFTICAVFAVPTIGVCLQAKKRYVRAYLLLIVWIGCVFAVSAVVFRSQSTLLSINYRDHHRTSIFAMDRMEQLTRQAIQYEKPLKAFERLVPSNATVAVFLGGSFEYPLFGEHLTRTIIPINSFNKGLQPIPSSADYLLYTQKGFPCVLPDDVYLGDDWYLRRLTDANRRCP